MTLTRDAIFALGKLNSLMFNAEAHSELTSSEINPLSVLGGLNSYLITQGMGGRTHSKSSICPLLVAGGTYIAVVGLTTATIFLFQPKMKRSGKDYDSLRTGMNILNNTDHTLENHEFEGTIEDYEKLYSGSRSNVGAISTLTSVELRKARYQQVVDHFYNLVTDFYEWGWGQSFHFSPRFCDEDFIPSIRRAEYFLCARLRLTESVHLKDGTSRRMKALDVGCGVGGPMRNMALFSNCSIEGITLNQYQVTIGNQYCQKQGLNDKCVLRQGDFQDIGKFWPASHFDAAFAIESTVHSPDRVVTFSGVAKVLRKGGLFGGYEWVLTDQYDQSNRDHVRIKEGIEVGNGLPTLVHYSTIVDNLQKSGFEVIECFDANRNAHSAGEIPWYDTLSGKMSISGFRMTRLGRACTHAMVWILESLCIAPKGSARVSSLLNATAIDLVDGGRLEIFTPSFFFLGRKI
jgi:sterol 24-C-methyltransferase